MRIVIPAPCNVETRSQASFDCQAGGAAHGAQNAPGAVEAQASFDFSPKLRLGALRSGGLIPEEKVVEDMRLRQTM